MKEQKFILIEDNENDVLLISRTLAKAAVPNPRHFVENGEAAIFYLMGVGPYADRKKYPFPGLVMLDLKLPGLTGFDVLQWIRQQPLLKELRVVVLTSSDEIRDANKAYRLGANSFLVKPLEFENVTALFSTLEAQRIWDDENDKTESQVSGGHQQVAVAFNK